MDSEGNSLVPYHKLGLFADTHRADGNVEPREELAHADPGEGDKVNLPYNTSLHFYKEIDRSPFLRVRPANYQSGWKLHGSDLRENRTIGSPRLVFHENGPILVIWALKN